MQDGHVRRPPEITRNEKVVSSPLTGGFTKTPPLLAMGVLPLLSLVAASGLAHIRIPRSASNVQQVSHKKAKLRPGTIGRPA